MQESEFYKRKKIITYYIIIVAILIMVVSIFWGFYEFIFGIQNPAVHANYMIVGLIGTVVFILILRFGSMLKCPYCGKTIPTYSKFCKECGKNLKNKVF